MNHSQSVEVQGMIAIVIGKLVRFITCLNMPVGLCPTKRKEVPCLVPVKFYQHHVNLINPQVWGIDFC